MLLYANQCPALPNVSAALVLIFVDELFSRRVLHLFGEDIRFSLLFCDKRQETFMQVPFLPDLGQSATSTCAKWPLQLAAPQWATFLAHSLWLRMFDKITPESSSAPKWSISQEADAVVDFYLKLLESLDKEAVDRAAALLMEAARGKGGALETTRLRFSLRKLQGEDSLSAAELNEIASRDHPRCPGLPLSIPALSASAGCLPSGIHLFVLITLDQWRQSKENARQALLNFVLTLTNTESVRGEPASADRVVKNVVESVVSAALSSIKPADSQFGALVLCSLCECRQQALETVATQFCVSTVTTLTTLFERYLSSSNSDYQQEMPFADQALFIVFPVILSQFGFEWPWSGLQRTSRRLVNSSLADPSRATCVMRTLLTEVYNRSYMSRMQQVLPASLQEQYLTEISADAQEAFSLSQHHPLPDATLAVFNYLTKSGIRTVAAEFRDEVESAVSVTAASIQLTASLTINEREKAVRQARMRFCAAMSALVLFTQGRRRSQFQPFLDMADPVLSAFIMNAGSSVDGPQTDDATCQSFNAFADVALAIGCRQRPQVTRRFLDMLECRYLAMDPRTGRISSTVSAADFFSVLRLCLGLDSDRVLGTSSDQSVGEGWARVLVSRLHRRAQTLTAAAGAVGDNKLLLDFELTYFEKKKACLE